MKKTLSRWLLDVWYKDPFIGVWLMPLGFIFNDFVRFRRYLYRIGVLKKQSLPVPVIVIGNITVGGTGKTPLIIWLANYLKKQGYKPGIVSRGYGGRVENQPERVSKNSTAEQVGDEAVLIARKSACPVAVGPLRADAAKLLLDNTDCDLILSDDGLQHYALDRDIEIAVIDGDRRFGNGHCLPAGPLREPIERIRSVDFVVVNGKKYEDNEYEMTMAGDYAVNLLTGRQKELEKFAGTSCHALAGIGNPDRFFTMLAAAGLNCRTHSFPDHYQFRAADISFTGNNPVLMTEKDAVKCSAFAGERHWYVPVAAEPDGEFAERLLALLREQEFRLKHSTK